MTLCNPAPYGTGSGKTFTMQPLPLRAAEDLVRLLHHPMYRNQRFKLWLSYFEIYGGKLFDLLSDRKLVSLLFFVSCFPLMCSFHFQDILQMRCDYSACEVHLIIMLHYLVKVVLLSSAWMASYHYVTPWNMLKIMCEKAWEKKWRASSSRHGGPFK